VSYFQNHFRQSVYLDQMSTWYDIKTHKPIVNKETIALVVSAIEISGLVGLDRLFSFMIISNLQKLSGFLENKSPKTNSWHNILSNIQKEISAVDDMQNPVKFYQNCINRTTKIWNDFLDCILLVGQLQLLRNLIAFHLNKSCKFNAKNLESSLRSLNK
jgi:WASH complex subunit strumpellin